MQENYFYIWLENKWAIHTTIGGVSVGRVPGNMLFLLALDIDLLTWWLGPSSPPDLDQVKVGNGDPVAIHFRVAVLPCPTVWVSGSMVADGTVSEEERKQRHGMNFPDKFFSIYFQ